MDTKRLKNRPYPDELPVSSRRDFIRIISLLSAGTLVSFKAINQAFSGQMSVSSARDHFSLNKFYPSVESIIIPEISYKKGEAVNAVYSMLSLGYDHFRRQGKVNFAWERQNDKIICDCLVERNSDASESVEESNADPHQLKSFYHQKSLQRTNSFQSPFEWTWSTKIAEEFEAKPFGLTEESGTGRINGDQLIGSINEKVIEKPLTDKALLKWAVWGLIPSLETNVNETFNWIDEMNQVYAGHVIRFRENVVISTQTGNLSLKSFQQTGPGLIPVVYWLDDKNILQFIVSGTEVYMLDEFNGRQVKYSLPEGKIERKNS